jgi:tetrahydromethanopterin S-methyltransferase subunit B
MNMLTPEDLNQIRTLLTDNNVVLRSEIRGNNAILRDGILADVGEMIEQNVLPKFDETNSRLDRLESRFDGLESRFDGLESRVDTLPDKNYLDEKLGKLRGEFIAGGHSPNQQFGHSF